MTGLLLRGGTVVGADGSRRADVLVRDERIVAVGADIDPGGAEVVDAGGAYVIPGGIDVHTHFALPVGAVTSADDFASGTLAAACGGTTCIVDFAGAGREPWEEALATWHGRARGAAVVDYGFHLTVASLPDEPRAAAERFRAFAERGVTSVKLYLAYPDRLMVDDDTLARALHASRATGVRVCVHAEDGATIESLIAAALADGRTGPDVIPSVRPPSVEAEAIRRAAKLAGAAGAWLYVVHLSSEAGLQTVLAAARGRRRHPRRDVPALPPSRRVASRAASRISCARRRCAAPRDRAALWSALGDGEVEVVATDHCPFTVADRRRGTHGTGWADFTQIPGGLSGVEPRMSLVYQGVRDGRISLERWVDSTSTAPARLFGLERKGSIRPGLDGDVVVFDPEATRRLDAGDLHSRADHSAYEGLTVTGWPALTISRGRVVSASGEPADASPGWGRFVPPDGSPATRRRTGRQGSPRRRAGSPQSSARR